MIIRVKSGAGRSGPGRDGGGRAGRRTTGVGGDDVADERGVGTVLDVQGGVDTPGTALEIRDCTGQAEPGVRVHRGG